MQKLFETFKVLKVKNINGNKLGIQKIKRRFEFNQFGEEQFLCKQD